LPGRKKVYDDIDALRGSRAVQKWLEGMRAGPHRKTALYNLARHLGECAGIHPALKHCQDDSPGQR
jgi:hypothetical protein